MITREDFAKFMFHMRKAVPTFAPNLDDNETVGIWHQAFQAGEMADLRRVYAFVRDNESQFPSIARLKQLLSHEKPSRFDELVSLIGKHGAYKPPVVDDLMARTINRLGGWQRICDWTDGDLPFRRKDFDEAYADLAELKKMGSLPQDEYLALKGIHEIAPVASSPAKLAIAPPVTPKKDPKVLDWDAVRAVHPDLDLEIAAHLKAQGFFKLSSKPGMIFRYGHGQTPGNGWPYSFVDAELHMQKARQRNGHSEPTDPNQFDASRYSYEKYTD